MNRDQRFEDAIKRIDAANSEDPRSEMVDGQSQPRELLFAQCVYDWVKKLADNSSEELLLAARAHTLRRWMIPRNKYPKTTIGYHQWRDALAQFHANEAEIILQAAGYTAEAIHTVKDFITRANWPENTEACTLEDADCLVFLETKLANYIDEWEESKAINSLQRTFKKMTPKGRTYAMQLKLGEQESDLLQRAVDSTS